MKFYLDILKFNFLEETTYPSEIVAFVIRRLLGLGFLLLFWIVVSHTNSNIFDTRQIISYFLIAGAVEDLTFASSGGWDRDIRRTIRWEQLTNYLIKPVNVLRFWFVSFVGKRISITVYGIITLAVGIYIYPPTNLSAIPLFFVSLILTTITNIGIGILIGTVGFYSPEAGNVANVIDHITNILSGRIIPLNYFPALIKKIAVMSPFPVLTYFPVTILQKGGLDKDSFTMLGLSLFWAVALLTLGNICWKKALKNYDGVGI